MREDQKQRVVQRLHKLSLEEEASSSTTNISKIVAGSDNSIMHEFLQAGIDWIPRQLLSTVINKALSLSNKAGAVIPQSTDTIVVESTSNPRKPHVVNLFPNGKAECADCPGFASSSICAHSLVAFMKQGRIKEFISWLARTKRNTGGINFSNAITFGMPKGRGKKGERAPRKVGKNSSKKQPTTVVSRVSDVSSGTPRTSYPNNQQQMGRRPLPPERFPSPLSHQQPLFTPPQYPIIQPSFPVFQPVSSQLSTVQQASSQLPQFRPTIGLPATRQINPASQSVFEQCQQTPVCHANWPQQRGNTPSFPNPNAGQFMVYLLQFCPGQTSMCFGCGNPLKQDAGVIPEAPYDLVIVSKMCREWLYRGQVQSKVSNVYFHCALACVQRRQPNFLGSMCCIPPQMEPHLGLSHREYIRANLGM